jgi:hypothetical protein
MRLIIDISLTKGSQMMMSNAPRYVFRCSRRQHPKKLQNTGEQEANHRVFLLISLFLPNTTHSILCTDFSDVDNLLRYFFFGYVIRYRSPANYHAIVFKDCLAQL